MICFRGSNSVAGALMIGQKYTLIRLYHEEAVLVRSYRAGALRETVRPIQAQLSVDRLGVGNFYACAARRFGARLCG